MLISNISCLTRLSLIFHWVVVFFFVLFNLCLRTNLHMVNLTIFWTSVAFFFWGGGREIQQDTHSSHSEIPLTVTNLLVLDISVCVLDISVCVGSSQLWFPITYKTEMQHIIKEKYLNYATKSKVHNCMMGIYLITELF